MKFTHLHVHSHYSLLDGLTKIDELIEQAKKYNMDSLALTDHGVMYGIIEFYQKCKQNNIKPILGVEVYIAPNGRHNKRAKVDEERHHLVLLAKNNIGYKNLILITSIAHLEGFYYKPRVDWEILEKYHDGLIALTGCLGGEIPSLIKNGNYEKAMNASENYRRLFGQENFYLELQYHENSKIQQDVNKILKKIGLELNIPLVATNDVHYLNYEDRSAHDILLCLQTKKQLEEDNRMNMMEFDVSFRSPEQMLKYFKDTPEAIENTRKIADDCNVNLELGNIKLPQYKLPQGETAENFLNKLCVQGLYRRYGIEEIEIEELRNKEISGDRKLETRLNDIHIGQVSNLKFPPEADQPLAEEIKEKSSNEEFIKNVIDRMDYEIGVINKMGFSSYFLIVQDFVNWAKNNNILVGPGRGSAAGALVSYLLNITDIDPIKYDLLFERFLNPERISMPDIDIDFADSKREEVIKYVEDKYGRDHVAQIITFGTMAARAAIRDVGRVLGIPLMFCDRIAKMIPMFCSLDKALKIVPEIKEIYAENQDAKKLIDTAKKLEGVARHSSRHACGILITPEPLTSYVPLQYASAEDRTIVSQYSLHPLEDLGLLKMDFLGLKNLTIIERCVKIIQRVHETEIDIKNIPIDDGRTFKLFQEGNTRGVFQFESSGMRRYLKDLKPTDFEDLIAMVSLYRPGPMDLIPEYITIKHGKKPVYLHPLLKPILDKTHGIAIYQEQLLQIARDLAGFTLGEADVLRRAVGKKITKLLNEQRTKFIHGCVKNNIKKEIAEKIFAFIEPFAGYGFNRSHAACYAMIAYQTAYLKANYPAEFMAALLTADYGNLDKIALEIEECQRMGIEILPPDINESFKTFTVVHDKMGMEKKIRFGLSAIKNLGDNTIEAIKKEREIKGKFSDLDDFITRIDCKDFNRKSLESLIKSGSLDGLGDRGSMLVNLDNILNYSKNTQKSKKSGQESLFGESSILKLQINEKIQISKRQKLLWEKEFLGLYISGHPFKEAGKIFQNKILELARLNHALPESLIRVGGIVGEIKKIITKKGESMLFARLEDATGIGEIIVFPSILKEHKDIFQEGKAVIIMGKISNKDEINKIICNEATLVTANNIKQVQSSLPEMDFKLDLKGIQSENYIFNPHPEDIAVVSRNVHISITNQEEILLLKKIFAGSRGTDCVFLSIGKGIIKSDFSVNYTEIKEEIFTIVGEENVKIK